MNTSFMENRAKVAAFLNKCGQDMFRQASGAITRPYIDPAGPYSENLWDWDSYWAAVAMFNLAEEKQDDQLLAKVKVHALGSLLNFFDAQAEDGSLPILMSPKDNDWFDSLSNPGNNMAKPVQGLFLRLLDQHDAVTPEMARELLGKIKLVSECRKKRYLHQASGLMVWANDVAIGIDDDPAIWGRPDFSGAHIYHNSFLAMDLDASRELAAKHQLPELETYFADEYEKTVSAINTYCWDKRDKWYYSCDVLCRQNLRPHRYFPPLNTYLKPFWVVMPLRIRGVCGILPLVAGIADRQQAAEVVEKLLDRKEFWTDYGIRSMSLVEDRFYEDTRFRGNPSNWLGPIWIVTSYLAYKALKNYGYDREAHELSANTLALLAKDCETNDCMHEYYSPRDGHPISGPGFLNWNLLALCMDKN